MRLLFILVFISSISYGQEVREVLKFDNSKLNDTIPVVLPKQKLIAFLGRPNKIKNWDAECGLTVEQEKAKVKKLYFYGKTQFYIYDNKAEISVIDFSKGTFTYKTARITLTNRTTLNDLKKIYPKSVQSALKENKGRLVRLRPCTDCDGYCLLYFNNGKLSYLQFWEGC